MTRARKKVFLVTGIVLVLPVLFLVGEHFRGKWALAKYKAELVAKGEKLTVAECRPPIPDPEDNGYADFMRAMASVESQSIVDAAPPSMRVVIPGKVRGIQSLEEWPKSRSSKDSKTSNWQRLEEALDASREPLDAARIALLKPAFDGRINYSLVHFQIPPHVVTLRRASQCWNANALLQLHHGRLTNALEQLQAGLRLCEVMREERILISQLFVHFATASMAVGPTWQALQTPGWNDAQLARLQQSWQTNEFMVSMLRAMEMERAMYIDLVQAMRDSADLALKQAGLMDDINNSGGASGTQSFDDLTQQLGQKSGELLKRGFSIPLWQFGWSYEDERNCLASMQLVLEGVRSTVAIQSMRPSAEAAKALDTRRSDEDFYDQIRHFTSGRREDYSTQHVARAALLQAQRDLIVVAIVLKRYELRHAALPSDLGALVPEFLPGIPRDIFDGQPLRYRLGEGGRFLLYSIGKDGTDDGGNPTNPENGNSSFSNGRDLVWPQPATAGEINEADEKEKKKK